VYFSQCSWNIKSRISGDGSIIFLCSSESIEAWSVQKGRIVGKVMGNLIYDHLTVDGSRVWVYQKYSQTEGWDFGIPGSLPAMLSNLPPPKPHLNFFDGIEESPYVLSRVEETATGKVVFWLSSKRYEWPDAVQWDGQYLIAGYGSGDVLILDFVNMIPH